MEKHYFFVKRFHEGYNFLQCFIFNIEIVTIFGSHLVTLIQNYMLGFIISTLYCASTSI